MSKKKKRRRIKPKGRIDLKELDRSPGVDIPPIVPLQAKILPYLEKCANGGSYMIYICPVLPDGQVQKFALTVNFPVGDFDEVLAYLKSDFKHQKAKLPK